MNHSSQQGFDVGLRVKGAYLNETGIDQNTGVDGIRSATDN